jgi:nitrate reductase gamma subunit
MKAMVEPLAAAPSTRGGRPWLMLTAGATALLLAIGVSGHLGAGWGYALFVAATVLLAGGLAAFGVFALTKAGDGEVLRRMFVLLLCAGGAAYALSVGALAGHYVHETLAGRMEWQWIVFGPAVLLALVVLDLGLYRKLVGGNIPAWRRYRQYISRDAIDAKALWRTFVDEVVLHRTLFHTSKVRWLRHTLIFWGFVAMFAIELAAVVVRDGFPAFGWRDVWREWGHPVRLGFDAAYDLTGCMILAGCLIALGWRVTVNNSPERRYSDTPTTLFLLFVVVSGFVVEGLRILPTVEDPVHAYSFAGRSVAALLPFGQPALAAWGEPLWLVHVIGSCLFIAYVPVKRLVHSCATPLGRLMNSQKEMLAAKRRGVLGAMLPGRRAAPPNT